MNQEEERLREDMARHGQSLFLRGLSGGASGNISVRLPGGGLLATPTGRSLGALRAGDLSLLDEGGAHLSGPPPTKEVFMHLACYRANAWCRAVAHLHSPHAVAFSCLPGLDAADCLPAFTPYMDMRVGPLPLAPYCRPGSPDIGAHLSRLMPGRRAVLLANHGPVVCGKNLDDAVCNSEELENAARIFFLLDGRGARPLMQEERAALLTKAG